MTGEKARIIMLGDFDIRKNGQSLLAGIEKSSGGLTELLKLLLTFRNKDQSPAVMVERFWSQNNVNNSRDALHMQMLCLQKALAEAGLTPDANDPYVFKLAEGCSLDVDEFEHYIRKAEGLRTVRPAEAIAHYREALSLYRGEYLLQNRYSEWAIPARIHYHRLYIRSLLNQLRLLRAEDSHGAIVRACEESFRIDPYEEAVHLYYLQSLLELGRFSDASAWYGYITAKLYREFGVRPSPVLEGIYQRLFVPGRRKIE